MAWTTFFNAIFPDRQKSEHIKRKTDVLFQVFFTVIHNGQKKTPLHVSLCETIHDTCRSKKLIQILNRMGLCMSYDELEKIDVCLAERTIATAEPHRTPLSSIIKENIIIRGAMDNFDHEENAQSGKGGSHDTILMLFQNSNGTSQDSQQIISRISDNITPKRRSLEHILDCQKLVRRGKFTERGRISDTFQPSQRIDHTATITSSSVHYKHWVLLRHRNRYQSQSDHENELSTIPSFAAINSLLYID